MVVRQAVLVNQPRLKADRTGTLSFGTLYEVNKDEYDNLNTAAFEKDDHILVLVPAGEYEDFIIAESKRLLKAIEGV